MANSNIGNFSIGHVENEYSETGGAPAMNLSQTPSRNERHPSKRARSEDDDDIFETPMKNQDLSISNLLKEEIKDLKQRFKQVESTILAHAEDKKDNLLKNLVSMLSSTNDKFDNWSNHMLQSISDTASISRKKQISKNDNKKTTEKVQKPMDNMDKKNGNNLKRRRSTLRSVSFEDFPPLPKPSNDVNFSNPTPLTQTPRYTSAYADKLVNDKQLLSLPKNMGRQFRLKFDKNVESDKITQAMERSARTLTILDFNFGNTLRSHDVLLRVLNRELIGNLKKKLASQDNNDQREDDFFMINDAIDAIEHIEFRGNTTTTKMVKKIIDGKEIDEKIYTLPVNITFFNNFQRNIFEKYLRIFCKPILVMPYWHSHIIKFKNEILAKMKTQGEYLSVRPINKYIISGTRKDPNSNRWFESFAFDPLNNKYYASKIIDGKLISGQDAYRKEKGLNKFWNPSNNNNAEVIQIDNEC